MSSVLEGIFQHLGFSVALFESRERKGDNTGSRGWFGQSNHM
jgi:hypothetical protein